MGRSADGGWSWRRLRDAASGSRSAPPAILPPVRGAEPKARVPLTYRPGIRLSRPKRKRLEIDVAHRSTRGAAPAGAFTAERLARAGMRVTLIDEKLAWEKPCGGGLTYKAYNQYPFLFDNDTPKKILSRTRLA